jgi:hypothetical protein
MKQNNITQLTDVQSYHELQMQVLLPLLLQLTLALLQPVSQCSHAYQKIVTGLGRQMIVWEEAFDHMGTYVCSHTHTLSLLPTRPPLPIPLSLFQSVRSQPEFHRHQRMAVGYRVGQCSQGELPWYSELPMVPGPRDSRSSSGVLRYAYGLNPRVQYANCTQPGSIPGRACTCRTRSATAALRPLSKLSCSAARLGTKP